MLSSNTICVSQEGPANALALNRECSQVVIAGRNVFKVFSIENDQFSEVCNLRVGKNLNLNFSSIDVAWSSIEENTLATAATNGAVVVWNLGRSGRSKQEHVFSDHKRTVNKVSFHLTEPALLISGSQDGTMKYFDLRMKEVARTFLSNTESVRDVQFSPHAAHTFASVSENGNVQLWDVRRAERCFHQFTAHSGPVFACDWHPEVPWLATASRDKTIKVWDIHGKPTLEHTIYTIASVGHVKWRPQKKYHIASCALVLDSSVNIWDVRRPHVPYATFAEHRDVTTAIAWKGDPDVFLSTSRDCTLYRHTFRTAAHPVLWANPHGVCLSARGELAQAASRHRHPSSAQLSQPNKLLGLLSRKQLPTGTQYNQEAALEALFPLAAVSQLTRWNTPEKSTPFLECAKKYRMRGAPIHQLCKQNAQVARDAARSTVAHVWDVVGAVYKLKAESAPRESSGGSAGGDTQGEGSVQLPAPPYEPPPDPRPEVNPPYSYSVDDEPEIEEWSENQFHNSGVLGLPTQSIYIPPLTKHANSLEEEKCWVTAASTHYVDVEAADWTLPEEAFPLRTAPPAPPHPEDDTFIPIAAPLPPPPVAISASPSSASSGSIGSLSSTRVQDSGNSSHQQPLRSISSQSYSQQNSITTVEDGPVGQLRVRGSLQGGGDWEAAPLIAAALRLHADLGDIQTPVCVMMTLGDHRSDMFPYIEEALQEHWLLGYLELLQRNKLWNISTELIRSSWVSSVWQMSQQSTAVHVACGRCGRRLPRAGHAPCERCQAQPALCAVCHQVVRGLFAWCQGCAHGGHLQHMRSWMEKHKQCPAGCGHLCQFS